MLGLFSRRRRNRPASYSRSVRPWLEALEGRDCPAAPQIMSFQANVLPGHQVHLTGMISAEQPATVNVTFSGAVSGSTTAASNGSFDFFTTTASLGKVYAVAVNQQLQSSNTVATYVTVTPPVVSLSLSYGAQRTVTLTGTVNDIDSTGLTVTFTGVVTGSVVTTSNGAFSYTAQASALGTIQASTVNLWSQSSNTALVTVASNAPVIRNFGAVHGVGNVWTFQGQVTDESAAGLIIHFGGLVSLENRTVTVGQDGWFHFTIALADGEEGSATAQTTDWWGLNSNQALTTVFI